MRRLILFAILVATGALAVGITRESSAEIENQIFTARGQRFRLTLPRNWRVTEQASYPGYLLWLMRSQPEGKIVVTAEQFTREMYCSWSVPCRTSRDPFVSRYACALREKLINAPGSKMRVGPTQAGPKDNEANRWASVWFEAEDGAHFMRQAIAFSSDNRVVSMVLSAPSEEARRAHSRAFEQMLRTLRSTDEPFVTGDAAVAPTDPAAIVPVSPPGQISPVGPCAN